MTLMVMAFYLGLAAGSETTSKASCQLSTIETEPDVGIVNGEPDAGVRVGFTLRNAGQAGPIQVDVRLSTSEGEFSRSQSITADGNGSRRLRYFFHEPTINAENIQAQVTCRP